MEESVESLRHSANELYDEWKEAYMKGTMKLISNLHDLWMESTADQVVKEIYAERKKLIAHFVRQKGKYDPSFSEDKVKIFRIEFPDGKDKSEWISYAKKACMRLEQFRSHAFHQNPHPVRPRKSTAPEDTRPVRSDKEQAWLTEEDRLVKLLTHLEKAHRRKQREQGAMTRKKDKKRRTRSKKHAKKPETPMHGGDSIAPAIQPYQRAAPAIQPYQRAAPRQPPRTAARLPAFPAFPRY